MHRSAGTQMQRVVLNPEESRQRNDDLVAKLAELIAEEKSGATRLSEIYTALLLVTGGVR